MSNNEPQARIEAIGEQLRAKITSKFQTSTFLAGFGLTILAVQVSTLWEAANNLPALLPYSIAVMVVSIYIYITAVLKLDELTMPKRFWKEEKEDPDPVKRASIAAVSRLAYLNDEDLWQLQKEMVFYWWSRTIVATGLTGASLMLMLVPLDTRQLSTKIIWETVGLTIGGLAVMSVYFVVLRETVAGWKRRGYWKERSRLHD